MCSALLDKATIGYIVPEYFKWPGFLSPSMGLKFSDVPNGLAAIGKVPGNGWAQIVAFAGYYELFVYKYNGVPGEYGWKAISSADPEVRKRKLSAELANGRLVSFLRIGVAPVLEEPDCCSCGKRQLQVANLACRILSVYLLIY